MSLNTRFDEFLEFPNDFLFKVVGLAQKELPDLVMNVLQQHAPGDYSPKIRASAKGTYHTVSVRVKVDSKEHIETLYTELGKIEIVRTVL
ncbi:DUF493 family protein YbeD [Motilimonas cestriensis]|uniref:UPF0250 protein K6Y31_02020 n=1 Tax=Motilimonas cestriensis TaxID=2742685 RepID=A0ABS8W3R2_9GAMM|nr:DUF493 family protein YbeD [Motilimonas cestriensis]MCE2593587.1 DUF493 family protein YbeD [Motilimonas cestriensis]